MPVIMPIMIGNSTIGVLTISRLERLGKKNAAHTYEYELYMKEGRTLRGGRPEERHTGTVEHVYEDGPVTLLKKVMAQIP